PFAILNMIAAFDTVHGYYLTPNENSESPMAYGYTDETLAPQLNCGLNPGNCRYDSFGNTYIMIPATS
ncbi:PE-PPE domain-containing protein, partial [Mycobacterium sp. ITM-2017-0098]